MSLILQAKSESSTTAASRRPMAVLTKFLRGRNVEAKAVIFAAYFLAGHASIELQRATHSGLTFWAPAGIATAAFLIRRAGIWYLVFSAAFLVNVLANGAVIGSAVMALGQTFGPLTAAIIVGGTAERTKLFFRPTNVFKFVMVAAPVAAAISASIGAATLCLIGHAPNAAFITIWIHWWRGGTVGIIALTPLIVLLVVHHRHALDTSQSTSFLAAMVGLIFACILVFCPTKLSDGNRYDMQFLALPLLAVFVLRYCPMETAIANSVIAGFTFWTSIHKLGPFSYDRVPGYVSAAFVAVICATNLVLSAAFATARENSESQLILGQVALAAKRVEIADLRAQLNELRHVACAQYTDSDSRPIKSSNQEFP